jgi:hypothetical protein
MSELPTTDVLIIGAGISGLMAARILKRNGYSATLIDKGRSVGGRLATRRIGEGLADTGAQFFTVRHGEFQSFVNQWMTDDLAFVWSHGWSQGSITDTHNDGHPRYAIKGGFNALPKYLARGLECHVDTEINSLHFDGEKWITAASTNGSRFEARALLLTPPVPQSLALLENSTIRLADADQQALAKIQYVPCLCGLFWLEGDVYLPQPGALQRTYADVPWIADNQRKGISPAARIITIHAGHAFSRAHYETSDEELISRFKAELVSFMNPAAHIREAQIKRWRYSMPTTLHTERCLTAQGLPLVFAGDGFAEARVEGASLSGIAAAGALMGMLE